MPSPPCRYFSCQSPKERDEWIASLKKTLMMNEDRRRTDNSLRLDVLEVKGLPEKKKYYAEILVDDKLYARTSAKKLTSQCCFWGEQFEFKVRLAPFQGPDERRDYGVGFFARVCGNQSK